MQIVRLGGGIVGEWKLWWSLTDRQSVALASAGKTVCERRARNCILLLTTKLALA